MENFNEFIKIREDGKQVVKKVPPGYILLHKPTGMFFPPESSPGWKGVLLDEDWELVDVSFTNQNVLLSPMPQQSSVKENTKKTQTKRQINTQLKSEIKTIQSALKLSSFLESSDEVDIEDLWESSIEFLEHSIENLKELLEKAVLEIREKTSLNNEEVKFLNSAQDLTDYLKTLLSLVSLKGDLRKSLSSGVSLSNLSKQIINGNFIYKRFKDALGKRKSEGFFVGKFLYDIYDALRQFEFSKRSLSMFYELYEISEQFLKEKDLQKKKKYQLPMELLLSQIQKILNSRKGNFISVPIHEEFVDKGMFAFFVSYPEFLFNLVKKDLGIKEKIKSSVYAGNGVFNYELENGTYVVVEVSKYFPGKENLYVPKTDYKYKGQQNYFLPILRVLNYDKISDEFSIKARIYSDEEVEKKSIEKTFVYMPFSHGFESSFVVTHFLVFDADEIDKIEEYKRFLKKTEKRAKKISNIVDSLDFKTLVKESINSVLYDMMSRPPTLGLSFLDFLFLKQLYPKIFEGEHSFQEVDKLIKDLFGLKLLFPKDEQRLIDEEIFQAGPNSFYILRRNLLSASLRYLSLIDYEYNRNKSGPVFDFTVREKSPSEIFSEANNLAPNDLDDFDHLYRIAELSFTLASKFFDGSLTDRDIINTLLNSGLIKNFYKDLHSLYITSSLMIKELSQISSNITVWMKYKGGAFEKIFLKILEIYLNDRYNNKEYSTSSVKRRLEIQEIRYKAYEVGTNKYILYIKGEYGGIGDVRMFVYDKSSKEVIPIIYELKARDKYVVPQLNSSKELYRTIHDVLLSFDEKVTSYKIYKPYIYGIGVKAKQGTSDIYIVDMNNGENLAANIKKVKIKNKDAIIIYAPRVAVTPFSLIGNSVVTSEETFN
ncbi:hypothetical protein TMA_002 [Thermus phage TMA]|uniref:hypothetical protein n=1 Tax=Thermus phage TMA TaxID=699370 RepID=UPI00021AAE1B|nr:hypothetical protein TMA_002 [Thermus phage TMA]BAK53690.1 hypothetical protein TMA_002 [Thermus phage TMA]